MKSYWFIIIYISILYHYILYNQRTTFDFQVLGGNLFTQDFVLVDQLQCIYNLILFYHGSLIRLIEV